MSWLCSRALVAAYSAATCSAGAPSAPSNASPTPQAYLPPDKMTAYSRPSRSGMTFAPLTDDLGADVLTWFLAAFPARTSASLETAQASRVSALDSGASSRASWATFDPATSSWKTAQRSLLEDSAESSVIWPRSGMTVGGRCWELPMLAHRTGEIDSGWLLPTPTASSYGSCQGGSAGRDGQVNRPSLQTMARQDRWPTPTVTGNNNRPGAGPKSGTGLNTAAKSWPTPIARDYRSGKASEATHAKNSRPLSEQVGGSLSPTWVEWLMGWPLGWTDLKPLATDKFHEWQLQRSPSSPHSSSTMTNDSAAALFAHPLEAPE